MENSKENPNIFKVALDKYRKYGIGGLLLILVGTLIQERVLDFINGLVDILFTSLVEMNIQFQNYLSYLLILTGFAVLVFMFIRAQQDVNKQVEKIRQEYEKGDLQILEIFEQWSEQEKYKHIQFIIRNGTNVSVVVSGEISPVLFKKHGDLKWSKTEYERSVNIFVPGIKIEPKQTERLSLARAEKDKDGFFFHCAINNPYFLKEVGYYRYDLSISGVDENKNTYYADIEGYFLYSGGNQLRFVKDENAAEQSVHLTSGIRRDL